MSHSEHRRRAPASVCIAILTVSDTRTVAEDESGHLIRELAETAGHTVAQHRIVPDDPGRMCTQLHEILAQATVQAVVVNGGTGIAPRDRTPEALCEMFQRKIDGFGEFFRSLSYKEIGSAAMLSRAVAGIVDGRAVFSVPGSPAAVRLAMQRLILPEIGHIVGELSRKS